MKAQRLMWIAWPAFLVAGLIEMVVFAFVDPAALHWADQPLAISREGAVLTVERGQPRVRRHGMTRHHRQRSSGAPRARGGV